MVNETEGGELPREARSGFNRRVFGKGAISAALALGAGDSSSWAGELIPRPAAPADGPIVLAESVLSREDDKLLDMVQQQTLKLFTHYCCPDTGMALERTNWEEDPEYKGNKLLATGATGFGVMALIAGVKRGEDEFRKTHEVSGNWPTKRKALQHLTKLVDFLDSDKVTKYHGAFAHWVLPDGKTFVAPWTWNEQKNRHMDDGGDLLETSFLIMGLLTAKEYFKDDPEAKHVCDKITKIWEEVDWKYYTNNENKLHWLCSADGQLTAPIRGWNEGLVTYVLAASAPKKAHRISPEVYHEGWGATIHDEKERANANVTALQYHCSLTGIDPYGLKDKHLEEGCADYFEQGKKHITAMVDHAVKNPNGHGGYGEDCWGFSECDGKSYSDRSKGRYQPRSIKIDDGHIAAAVPPTSVMYAPKQALAFIKRFYKDENIWGECGPVDAFNLKPEPSEDGKCEPWYDKDSKGKPVYIGIHQLPISVMIENYRSKIETGQGFLWSKFMQITEVKDGLRELGFESPHLAANLQNGNSHEVVRSR